MPVFNPVYDAALNVLTNECDEIHACSSDPTTYAEATSTYSIGVKTSPVISAPANRTGGGRQVSVSSFADGMGTTTGTAGFLAYVDSTTSRLLASTPLASPVGITEDATFPVSAHTIGIPSSCP